MVFRAIRAEPTLSQAHDHLREGLRSGRDTASVRASARRRQLSRRIHDGDSLVRDLDLGSDGTVNIDVGGGEHFE